MRLTGPDTTGTSITQPKDGLKVQAWPEIEPLVLWAAGEGGGQRSQVRLFRDVKTCERPRGPDTCAALASP